MGSRARKVRCHSLPARLFWLLITPCPANCFVALGQTVLFVDIQVPEFVVKYYPTVSTTGVVPGCSMEGYIMKHGKVTVFLAAFTAAAVLSAGCDSTKTTGNEEGVPLDSEKNAGESKDTVSDKSSEKTKDKNAESKPDENSREFVSFEKEISIILPEGWSVTHDQKSQYRFQAQDGSWMEIISTEGRARMAVLEFPESEQEACGYLGGEGYTEVDLSSEDSAFDQIDQGVTEAVDFYRYRAAVRGENQEEYLLRTGVRQKDQAYQVKVSLSADDEQAYRDIWNSLKTLCFLDNDEMTRALAAGLSGSGTAAPADTGGKDSPDSSDAGKVLIPEPVDEDGKDSGKQDQEKPKKEKPVTSKGGSVVCSSDANVRTAPGTGSSQVIGAVRAGDVIEVTGETGNWYQFTFEGQTAYVCKDYFEGGQQEQDGGDPEDTVSPGDEKTKK